MAALPGVSLVADILRGPGWLVAWVGWLIVINTASLLHLRRPEGRWVLSAWVANLLFMSILHYANGFNRLLGLSHLVFWTPLLLLLWRRRAELPRSGGFGRWIRALWVTNAVSLLIDTSDVVRYLLGDRG